MEKIIQTDFSGQNDLIAGVKIVADAVGATFGAAGHNVIIESAMCPKITKDGVSVARTIRLRDPVKNMGAQALIDLAKKILDRIGDGTTTACVFGEALLQELVKVKKTVNRENLAKMCAHIEGIIENADKFIKVTPENFLHILTGVARISSNKDPEITSNINAALRHVGMEGSIVIEETKSPKTKITPKNGMQINHGYSNPLFTNKLDRLCFDHDNVNLVLYDGTLESFDASAYFWEQYIHNKLSEPLLLISRGFGGLAEMGIVGNIQSNEVKLKFCNITINGTEDEIMCTLNDLSAATGAPIMGREHNKEFSCHSGRIELDDLTLISKASVFRNYSLLVAAQDRAEELSDHKKALESELESIIDDEERKAMEERIQRLSQKIISIAVGSPTETSLGEIKDRYEDTVYAIRSAIKHGVIPAGGYLWMKILKELYTLTPTPESELFMNAIARTLVKLYRGVLNDDTNNDFTPGENTLKTAFDIIENHKKAGEGKIYDLKIKEYVDINEKDFYEPIAIIQNIIGLATSFAWDLASSEVCITADRDAFKDMFGK